jgi:hypothetical protein
MAIGERDSLFVVVGIDSIFSEQRKSISMIEMRKKKKHQVMGDWLTSLFDQFKLDPTEPTGQRIDDAIVIDDDEEEEQELATATTSNESNDSVEKEQLSSSDVHAYAYPENRMWTDKLVSARRRANECIALGKLVTSFTTAQPLQGWRTTHALRELWQNFRDGLHADFGGNVTLARCSDRLFVAREVHGQLVGWLDSTRDDVIVISQAYCSLGVDYLQLATSKAAGGEFIGGFGEGAKVALCLLLRSGFDVTFELPFVRWRFSLERVYREVQFENMVVYFEPADARRDLLIRVHGPGAHRLFDPQIDIRLLSNDLTLQCRGQDGALYAGASARLHGRVYARGLHVAVDRDFELLRLVVNLNAAVARDRHLLPSNTWDLIERILNEAVDQAAAAPQPAWIAVFDHLMAICAEQTAESLRRSLPHIKSAIRRYVALHNGVPVDRVAFVGDDSPSVQLLRDLGKLVVDNVGALADVLDVAKLRKEFVGQAPLVDVAQLDDDERAATDAIGRLFEALRINANTRLRLAIKDIPPSLRETLPFVRKSQSVAVFDRSFLEPQNLSASVYHLFMKYRFSCGMQVTSRMLSDFARDPLGYIAKRYEQQALPANRKRDNAQAASSSQASAAAASSSSSPSAPSSLPSSTSSTAPRSSVGRDPLMPDARSLNECSFRGDTEFGDVRKDRAPIDRGSCTHIGPLRVVLDFDIPLYAAEGVSLERSSVLEPLADVANIVAQLRAGIGRALNLSTSDRDDKLPIMFAYVPSPSLMAFTRNGGIFVNLLPLLSLSSTARRRSLFLSILHELAHRTQADHNSQFADQLARILFSARHVID